jgi:hypothetical protein
LEAVWGGGLKHIREAEWLVAELWAACEDPRTPEEIIDGVELDESAVPSCGWPEFKEKLYLLGQCLDYAGRLLEGAVPEAFEAGGGEEER